MDVGSAVTPAVAAAASSITLDVRRSSPARAADPRSCLEHVGRNWGNRRGETAQCAWSSQLTRYLVLDTRGLTRYLVQGYIAADELLFNPCSPCLRADLPKPLVNRSPKTYDMEAHYRFGGTIPTLQSQAWPPLYKEVLSFIGKEGTPGVMPSAPKLQAAGRGDLVKAIGRAGGWHKVATELGLQMAHSLREVYFTCPSALRSGQEIEFKLPGMPQRFAATVSAATISPHNHLWRSILASP